MCNCFSFPSGRGTDTTEVQKLLLLNLTEEVGGIGQGDYCGVRRCLCCSWRKEEGNEDVRTSGEERPLRKHVTCLLNVVNHTAGFF